MTRETKLLIDMWDILHRECHKVVTEENYDAIKKSIKALEQEPKTGHWILTDDDFVYCSECEDSYYQRPIDASWNYCPHCGAKMVEKQESEDKK